jgi:hypothetical protein
VTASGCGGIGLPGILTGILTGMQIVPLVAAATRLVMISGTGYDHRHRGVNTVLHAEDHPGTIRWVADLLDTLEPSGEDAWLESPTAALVFLDGRAPPLLELGLLPSGWIRIPGAGDAPPCRDHLCGHG